MTCPHLEYRSVDGTHEFTDPRAYCTVADRFVQPMRADICNDRFALDHASHCEIYRTHAEDSGEERGGGPSEEHDGEDDPSEEPGGEEGAAAREDWPR